MHSFFNKADRLPTWFEVVCNIYTITPFIYTIIKTKLFLTVTNATIYADNVVYNFNIYIFCDTNAYYF